jgi:hypothetical protein
LPLNVLEPVLVTADPATTDAAAAVPRFGAVADQAGDAPKASVRTPTVKTESPRRSDADLMRIG